MPTQFKIVNFFTIGFKIGGWIASLVVIGRVNEKVKHTKPNLVGILVFTALLKWR